MKKWGIILLVFWGCGGAAWAQTNATQQALLEAIKANPNDANAHFNLGVAYINGQQFDQAVPEFQKCVQLNPADNKAKELLELCEGIEERIKGNDPTAVQHFQAVLKINPENADARRFLAQCLSKVYMDEKQYAQAVTQLKEIIGTEPKNFGACQNLGVAYFQMKDYKNAVLYWEKALRLQKDAQTYKFLGFSYYNLGDFNDAISNYQKSIQMESAKDPKDQNAQSLGETYYNLAVAYNDNAAYDEAADAFGQAFKLNPRDSSAAVNQANAIDEAVNSHMEKASSLLLNNQYSDAVAEMQKVLKYQPDNKQAQDFVADAKTKLDTGVEKHILAGKAYYKRRKMVEALNEWNQALEMDPNNQTVIKAINSLKGQRQARVKSLVAEGDSFYATQDYSDALLSYKRAEGVDPRSSMVRARLKKLKKKQSKDLNEAFTKGMHYYSKGDLKNAQKYLLTAKQVDSGNAKIDDALFKVQKDITVKVKDWDAQGVSLFEKGDKGKAQQKFQAVLKYKPNDETANEYVKKMTGQQSQEKVDAEKLKTLYYDGVNLYINGKIHEAVEKWQECLKQDPGNINAKKNIEKAMVKLQSIEKLSRD